jgi:hypothetical protein
MTWALLPQQLLSLSTVTLIQDSVLSVPKAQLKYFIFIPSLLVCFIFLSLVLSLCIILVELKLSTAFAWYNPLCLPSSSPPV